MTNRESGTYDTDAPLIAILAASNDRGNKVAQACRTHHLAAIAVGSLSELWALLEHERRELRALSVDWSLLELTPSLCVDLCQLRAQFLNLEVVVQATPPAALAAQLAALVAAGRLVGWNDGVFTLGPLTVDRAAGLVELDGASLPITELLFGVLLALCEAWRGPGEVRVVRADYDDIRRLRGLLGKHAYLIVTEQTRGYRLVRDSVEARKRFSGTHRLGRPK